MAARAARDRPAPGCPEPLARLPGRVAALLRFPSPPLALERPAGRAGCADRYHGDRVAAGAVRRLAAEREAILEAIPAGLAIYDETGQISSYNRAVVDLLGLSLDDGPGSLGERLALMCLATPRRQPLP